MSELRSSLAQVLQDRYPLPRGKSWGWLLAQNASALAVASPWPVRVGWVLFQPDGTYIDSRLGDFTYIFAIEDAGIIDIAAWHPATGRIASKVGVGALIGQEQIGSGGKGTTGVALPVWRDPLRWLRADRDGIVIVDSALAANLLAGVSLLAEDLAHAAELREALRVPPPTILTPNMPRRAA